MYIVTIILFLTHWHLLLPLSPITATSKNSSSRGRSNASFPQSPLFVAPLEDMSSSDYSQMVKSKVTIFTPGPLIKLHLTLI